MFDIASARALLPGRRIEWLASTDSTMIEAARLIQEGAPAGTVVIAEEQTAGIGRHGHSWHSESGAGLYVSIVLEAARELPPVMLALGLAALRAIADASGLAPDLRWPNDVLLAGKKCAGVMAQLESGKMIAGIGINVGQTAFPPELEPIATSLKLAGAHRVSREQLLAKLVNYAETLAGESASVLIEKFHRASSYTRGRHVRVDLDGRIIEGITQGLDASGFLIVREASGNDTTILAGGVRPI